MSIFLKQKIIIKKTNYININIVMNYIYEIVYHERCKKIIVYILIW